MPGADLSKGIYQKPRTRAPKASGDRVLALGATCVANLVGILMILVQNAEEKALSIAWRTGVNATNMCSAEDIYDGKVTAVMPACVDLASQR